MGNISTQALKRKILPVLKRHGVKRAAIFGSFRKKKTSDIDILVEFKQGKAISLLDFIGFKLEIEDTLGKKIDLVEYGTIKPLIRDQILKEQKVIL